jgi:putative transposase
LEPSNSLDSRFCVEALETAVETYGRPDIFNSDQVSQFTSEAFTSVLKAQDIRISMDDKGRWVDNVFVERLWRSLKYEEVYLKGYATVAEARTSISDYLRFFNQDRRHQSLDRQNLWIARRLIRCITIQPANGWRLNPETQLTACPKSGVHF